MPQVQSLLSPGCSLILKLTGDGYLHALGRQFNSGSGSYDEAALISAPIAVQGSQPFEFGLLTGQTMMDSFGNPVSAAALLVESYDSWDDGWDDECARVIGGAPFPYGRDPIGQKDTSEPRATKPLTTRGVYFSSHGAGAGVASSVTLQGVNKTTIATIPAGVELFYLALWLPAGINGYMKFPGLPNAGKDTFTNADVKSALSS